MSSRPLRASCLLCSSALCVFMSRARRALRALVPQVPHAPHALVPHVCRSLRAPMLQVYHTLHALLLATMICSL